jgi:hypothetical protein
MEGRLAREVRPWASRSLNAIMFPEFILVPFVGSLMRTTNPQLKIIRAEPSSRELEVRFEWKEAVSVTFVLRELGR